MTTDRLKNEAIICVNGLPGKQAQINLEPLADLFNSTSCISGKQLSEKIENIKNILVLSFDESADIEVRKLKDAYFTLCVLSEVINQFKLEPLVESGLLIDPDQLPG